MILSCSHFASKCETKTGNHMYLIVTRAKKGNNFEQRWRFCNFEKLLIILEFMESLLQKISLIQIEKVY